MEEEDLTSSNALDDPEQGEERDEAMTKLLKLRGLKLDSLTIKKRELASFFGPTFWRALAHENTKNIFISGCGGGFDFVHSAVLVPALKALGKNLVFLSYSFGSVNNLSGSAEVVW
jgi:hypothetical protein